MANSTPESGQVLRGFTGCFEWTDTGNPQGQTLHKERHLNNTIPAVLCAASVWDAREAELAELRELVTTLRQYDSEHDETERELQAELARVTAVKEAAILQALEAAQKYADITDKYVTLRAELDAAKADCGTINGTLTEEVTKWRREASMYARRFYAVHNKLTALRAHHEREIEETSQHFWNTGVDFGADESQESYEIVLTAYRARIQAATALTEDEQREPWITNAPPPAPQVPLDAHLEQPDTPKEHREHKEWCKRYNHPASVHIWILCTCERRTGTAPDTGRRRRTGPYTRHPVVGTNAACRPIEDQRIEPKTRRRENVAHSFSYRAIRRELSPLRGDVSKHGRRSTDAPPREAPIKFPDASQIKVTPDGIYTVFPKMGAALQNTPPVWVKVYCDKCGNEIADFTRNANTPSVKATCSKCLNLAAPITTLAKDQVPLDPRIDAMVDDNLFGLVGPETPPAMTDVEIAPEHAPDCNTQRDNDSSCEDFGVCDCGAIPPPTEDHYKWCGYPFKACICKQATPPPS